MRALVFFVLLVGCSSANQLGVGAECTADNQCGKAQKCLTQFKGGYCGLSDCTKDSDCPSESACISAAASTADGGTSTQTFCFLVCTDKPQCNANRTVANEANCSSSADFVDGGQGRKACVPPSGNP
jgi:hypothetical protein